MIKFLIFIILLSGCAVKDNIFEQTCLTCGEKFDVIQYDGGLDKTVSWCVYDGVMCDEGFKMLLENKMDSLTEHCVGCIECKMSMYSPEDWKNREN